MDAKWIPPLSERDPEECRLSWRIEVNGPVQESAIKAVFDWVEGECDLKLEAFGPAAEAADMMPAPKMPQPVEVVTAAVAPPVIESAPAVEASLAPKNNAASTQAAASAAAAALPSAAAGDGGSIRVSIEKIDELLNSVGELVITQSVLSQLAAPLEGHDAEALRNALGQLERHMRNLQESVMRVRMLPISFVFNRFRAWCAISARPARRSSCA